MEGLREEGWRTGALEKMGGRGSGAGTGRKKAELGGEGRIGWWFRFFVWGGPYLLPFECGGPKVAGRRLPLSERDKDGCSAGSVASVAGRGIA